MDAVWAFPALHRTFAYVDPSVSNTLPKSLMALSRSSLSVLTSRKSSLMPPICKMDTKPFLVGFLKPCFWRPESTYLYRWGHFPVSPGTRRCLALVAWVLPSPPPRTSLRGRHVGPRRMTLGQPGGDDLGEGHIPQGGKGAAGEGGPLTVLGLSSRTGRSTCFPSCPYKSWTSCCVCSRCWAPTSSCPPTSSSRPGAAGL